MLFHQFLILVLFVYACYYLLIICVDVLARRRLTVDGSADVSEFVVAPKSEPVRVVADHPKYQLDSDHTDKQDIKGFDDSQETTTEIESADFSTHDLKLETISTSGGIPVTSVKFMNWLKKAS